VLREAVQTAMQVRLPRTLRGRYLAVCYLTLLLGLVGPDSCRVDGTTYLHWLYMLLVYPAYLPFAFLGNRLVASGQEPGLLLKVLGVVFALAAPLVVLGLAWLVRAFLRFLNSLGSEAA
jgi:hypothetical protein